MSKANLNSMLAFAVAIFVCSCIIKSSSANNQLEGLNLNHHLHSNQEAASNATSDLDLESAPVSLIDSISSKSAKDELNFIATVQAKEMSAYTDSCEEYLYEHDQMHGKYKVSEFGLRALVAKLYSSVYSDMFIHKYDNYNDLRASGGPHTDQELCLSQLGELVDRVEAQEAQKAESKDSNLYQLMDTFGRVPAGLLLGHTFWIGSYDECLRLKIESSEGKLDTRYCVASLKHFEWKGSSQMADLAVLKAGVCLPKSCDSLSYKNKFELILKLVEFNTRTMDRDQANMTYLYCLPDAESSITQWWQTPASAATVIGLSLWVSLLVYCTIKYRKLTKQSSINQLVDSDAGFGLTSGFDIKSSDAGSQVKSGASEKRLKIYKSLSISQNLKCLFDVSKTSQLMETGDKLNGGDSSKESAEEQKQHVDLRILEGIKVLSMSYVIVGHVLMCLTGVVGNGREAARTTSPSFFIANLVPAFAVNSFFTITGLLTSYLMFKQNQSYSFITSPLKWVAFIIYRYLRIMPMYMIVVLYTKTQAKFAGSGPMWDYATTALAQRRTCEQESWLWTLLFGANFKTPLSHCIPSAWYLANDFQFFMITPIFLAILHKSPKLGQTVIKVCIWSGYFANFMSVYFADVEDLTPVARFMPHGFKTYVTFLHANYTRPYYRIPAYLCGLLIGFVLHNFERDKIQFFARQSKDAEKADQSKDADQSEDAQKEPGWSESFKNRGVFYSILFVSLCVITPLIGSRLPFNKSGAKVMVAFIMPTYHVLFSLSVGIYILLATTGYGNKQLNAFLSSSFWKPLARLSLCAVLINVEVINYIIQSSTSVPFLGGYDQLALNITCILSTYLASIVVCVLFEAPVRAALNHLLAFAINKLASKRKTD